MPNAHIEIEAVRNPNGETWHGEVEASPPARRKVVNAKTFEDCIAQVIHCYNEIRPDGVPTTPTTPVEQPAAPPAQGDVILPDNPAENWEPESAIALPLRRGRHPNACTCERCEAKRAA